MNDSKHGSQTIAVSVALASYNGARFIEAQLQSFADQTRPPDQVVIRDDGSTDDTAAIIERFAATAPFVVDFAHNTHRRGYSRNFEGAVSACTGDIVFLSDQDDVWLPNKIETILEAFAREPQRQVFVNDQILTDGKLRHNGITKLSNLANLGIGADGLIEGCCTAFRRSWSTELLPIPAIAEALIKRHALSHDRWLNELAILLQVRGVMAEPLQYFRRYGSNTTTWLVSEPRRTGMRDLVATRVATAPVDAWQERIAVLNVYSAWIHEHRDALARLGGNVTNASTGIERERVAYAARCMLVVRSLPQRIWGAVSLWRKGGYTYFYGWKSALRDMMRSAA